MGGRRRRERAEPAEEWEQLALLCRWPEQSAYEEIRPLTLFGMSVGEWARETGTAERTLYRRVGRFEEEGGRGEPLRLGGGQAQEASLGHEAARRRPESRSIPALTPTRLPTRSTCASAGVPTARPFRGC